MAKVARHKAALSRPGLSRPAQILLSEGLLAPDETLLDYGCGKGGDVRRLRRKGYAANGWDPHFAPDEPKAPADVVTLGYVLNVIEKPPERREVLEEAWSLCRRGLLVAVRSFSDIREAPGRPHGDGYMTRIGTFQKYYDQTELKNWVSSITRAKPVPLAPGVVVLFKDDRARQKFVVERYRRAITASSVRRANEVFEAHEALFERLYAEFAQFGRIPEEDEWPEIDKVIEAAGSRRRALTILRRVYGTDHLEDIRYTRSEDLLVFLAMERFDGRTRFGELEERLQRDVRAFFGSYTAACEEADQFLFSAGNQLLIDAACRDSGVGKLMPEALFVHLAGLPHLDGVLRVVEGCARNLVGTIDGANLIKINRRKPKVSYLSYPDFDKVGHPPLAFSVVVDLRQLTARWIDFTGRENPPILHRKELFVPEGYPGRKKFARLSKQEARAGLLGRSDVGTQGSWEDLLSRNGFFLAGHQLRTMR